MFYVNNIPLIVDELDVVYKLKDDCAVVGLNIFNKITLSGNSNIMVTCPFHKGGQERRPSFGIARKDGVCHCFTCGWTSSLNEMISAVFGYRDNGAYGNRWLSRNFLSYDIQVRQPIKIARRNQTRTRRSINSAFTEEELDKYRYVHPYMYERGLNDEIIELFDVGYDFDTSCITFPVYNHTKTPVFIARRSVQTKFFNYPKNTEKPVYGAYRFYEKTYSYAVICESIFNALTCWKWKMPAVALLGTGSFNQYEILKNLPVRKYILGLDPDDAGRKGSEQLKKYLSPYKLITQYDIPVGKDINDLDEEVLNLVEYF